MQTIFLYKFNKNCFYFHKIDFNLQCSYYISHSFCKYAWTTYFSRKLQFYLL